MVLREGDRGNCMYRIIEGSVEVFITAGTEDEIVLTTLGQDRIFGEMAAIEAWPRSASIMVREDGTKLLEIARDELVEFFKEDPYQVRSIMENLSHRLRGLTDDYLEVCATVRDMKSTRGEKRSEGLLRKISRFISAYSRTVRYLTTSEESGGIPMEDGENVSRDSSINYRKDAVIFRQGDDGDCMYYIQLGSVGIYTDYGTDKEKQLVLLEEDAFFGEMGLIEKLPRSATAVAIEDDTVLRKITEEELEELFETSPALVVRCIEHLSRRLRRLTKDYLEACEMVTKLDEAEKTNARLTSAEEALTRELADAASRYDTWM
jgi:CRP-like cAMP-binding protein